MDENFVKEAFRKMGEEVESVKIILNRITG